MSSTRLQDAMDGWDPAPLTGLTDEHFVFLAEHTVSSRQRMNQEVDVAVTQSLEHVPRLLRRPVKKLLGI
ncbi:MAG: hypothetical protein KAZ88_12610 [Acidimicrobiia bacterium]|nr:hypothetical protein [Acidimicrobiia bacterium]MBP8181815.1 hypothetical protein [Acidimicrobiia bacterium]